MRLTDFINSIKGGQMGWSMVTTTVPKMRKSHNPYFGRVRKMTLTSNILFGMNYGKACTKKATLLEEGEKYNAEKPKGKTWEKYPYILAKDANPEVKYLRISYFPQRSHTKSIFLVDDRPATEEEMKIINLFLQHSKPVVKQTECGISDDEQVVVRDYDLTNISILKQGDKEWNASEATFESVKSKIYGIAAEI